MKLDLGVAVEKLIILEPTLNGNSEVVDIGMYNLYSTLEIT